MHAPIAAVSAVLLLAAAADAQARPLVLDSRNGPLPTTALEAEDFHHVDLDGDGLRDLVVSARRTDVGGSRILLDRGDGRFVPVSTPGLPGPDQVFAAVDFDGDRDADLLWRRGAQLVVFENDGAAGFTQGTTLPGIYVGAVVVGDVNGDRRPDVVHVVVRTSIAGAVEVLLNATAGPARFTAAAPSPIPAVREVLPELEDFDGDGDLDLFVGTDSADLLLVNDGSGSFTDVSAVSLPVNPALRTMVTHALDHDRDGDIDLLLGRDGVPDLLLDNNGSGLFTALPAATPPRLGASTATYAFASGDADGDRDIDVVVGTSEGVELWLRQGASYQRAAGAAVPSPGGLVEALALADIDRDADLDLLVGRSGIEGQVSDFIGVAPQVLYNDGRGSFAGPDIVALPQTTNYAYFGKGDFDGDGDVDLVESGAALLWNDGRGSFTVQPVVPAGPSLLPVVGDFDGDGLDDVVGVGRDRFEVWLHRPGPFPSRTTVPLPVPQFRWAQGGAPADFDGDGDLDVYISVGGSSSSSPDFVLRNQGAGTFTVIQVAAAINTLGNPVAAGDVDGDGDSDVVNGNAVMINDGTGSFSNGGWIATTNSFVGGVAIADLDRDGWNDVVVATAFDSYLGGATENVVAWNDRSGTWARSGSVRGDVFPGPDQATFGVGVGDLDGDGLLDVVFANGYLYGRQTRVFVQTAPRRFRPALIGGEVPADDDDSTGVVLLDADQDQDVDILVANSRTWAPVPSSRLYLNTFRQLRTPFVPRLGHRHELELWGSTGGGALFLSLRTGAVWTPLGLFGLDPATTISLPAVPVGDPGRMSLTIPTTGSLAGLTLHWQAIDVAPLRFTNVVRETVLAN